MALSHYHGDHVANASPFAGSTCIAQNSDRDVILGPRKEPQPTARAIDREGIERRYAVLEGAVGNLAVSQPRSTCPWSRATTASTSSSGHVDRASSEAALQPRNYVEGRHGETR
jgi:hypothetical protein